MSSLTAHGIQRAPRIRCVLLGIVVALMVSAPALGASTFTFSGDRTSIVFAAGRERTLLVGNARIVSEDTEIEAQEIEIYGDDFRFAVARGAVRVIDREQDIVLTADRLLYDRIERITRAEGNAVMEDRRNETVVKGALLENRGRENLTIIQVGVRILGEDLTTRSEFARYRRDQNILELSGLPVVFWRGDEYRASRIVIDIDRDEITLQGAVRGTITTSDEASEGASNRAADE
ncbi:MAG: hypothetical protein EA403_11890 [Spirochaetaceae bacterium]|nr:MAG: hypothetical protein EA403_11890 [Spirochaetaceae bacterium]